MDSGQKKQKDKHVKISADRHQQLKILSAKTGKEMKEIIENAFDQYISYKCSLEDEKQYEDEYKKQYLVAKEVFNEEHEFSPKVSIPAGSRGKIVQYEIRKDQGIVLLGVYFDVYPTVLFFTQEDIFYYFDIEEVENTEAIQSYLDALEDNW